MPFRTVEPADGEDEVVVALCAVGELLRRVRHHLRVESGRALEPLGDVARRGEELARLAEGDAIEPLHRTASGSVLGALAELPEVGAIELVGLAELVQEPDDLVAVAHGVRRELRRNHEIDRAAVGFLEIEQPPEERLTEHALTGVPLVGNRDVIHLVVARAQLGHEIVREDLGPPARERNLRRADGDPHGKASKATRA